MGGGYAYAANSPLNFFDPTGLYAQPLDECTKVCATDQNGGRSCGPWSCHLNMDYAPTPQPPSGGEGPGQGPGPVPTPRPDPDPGPEPDPDENPCQSSTPSSKEMADAVKKAAGNTSKISAGALVVGAASWLFPQFKWAKTIGAFAFEISEATGIMAISGYGGAYLMDRSNENAVAAAGSMLGVGSSAAFTQQLAPKVGMDPTTALVLGGMLGLGVEGGTSALGQPLVNPPATAQPFTNPILACP